MKQSNKKKTQSHMNNKQKINKYIHYGKCSIVLGGDLI